MEEEREKGGVGCRVREKEGGRIEEEERDSAQLYRVAELSSACRGVGPGFAEVAEPIAEVTPSSLMEIYF